jgi:hypothetical protein
MTPYEAWTGKKPDVSHFREFGCDVWVLDESKNRSKLSPKSQKMVFVEFMEGSKAVRYWDRTTGTVKVSRNVAFNENDEPQELGIVEVPNVVTKGEITSSASTLAPETTQNTSNKTTFPQIDTPPVSDT